MTRRAARLAIAAVLAGALAVATTALASCSRIGDDRFPKLPDADMPDAESLVPDAAGPADASIAVDAAVDAR